MIDRASLFTRRLADGMSRRGFLSRVTGGAAVFVAGLGAILATQMPAEAAPPQQCTINADCDTEKGEICLKGRCVKLRKKRQ